MKLNELKPARGAVRPRKRIGRGQGSGTGGTAGRGHKGHSSRSGGGSAVGFEGGQMPIQRRLPKGGFTNINRVEYQVVNVASLSVFEDGAEVTPATLKERRLARKATIPVKLLGRGELDRAVRVSVHAVSESARRKVEAAGGTVELVKSKS
jgi:large subunit ribosomal protein L15